MCGHHQLHVHARLDPTRTNGTRIKYEAELVRRFSQLARDVRSAIVDDDALHLDDHDTLPINNAAKVDWPGRTPEAKVDAFRRWLRQKQKTGVLEIKRGTTTKSGHKSWQDIYLQSAYQKGLAGAYGQVRKAGVSVSKDFVDAAFFRPIHADRVGLIYTRAYSELDGITRAVDARLSSILAQGMLEGRAPKKIAKDITDGIKSIGIARARKLARTEVVRAHSEATLNAYEESEIEGVNILSEFSTSADNAVCPKCEKLEGKEYTVAEARGIIPVHPNCRCTWLPVVSVPKGKRKLG